MSTQKKTYFKRHIALPSDHGSWVFLLSPLLIGFFAAGQWKPAQFILLAAALAAFLLRQPATVAVKAYAGRRSQADLPAARFWIVVYGGIGLAGLAALVSQGFGYVLLLAVPGLAVFGWHLLLVSKRAERYQMGIDIIASGTLALAAPAAYWVGVGEPAVVGWWLWGLGWFQSAASIVYAFLRLAQRKLKQAPDRQEKFEMARRALLYASFNLTGVGVLAAAGVLPTWLWLPFGLQWAEVLWGTFNPAVGVKPTTIGFRQLAVSILFTVLFIVCWSL